MTQDTLKKPSQNVSMDIYKLIASFLVVFIHIPFPGQAGKVVSCIARSAVPSFFAFSGFFSYGVSSERLLKRMKHMVALMFWGIFLYVGIACLAIECGAPSTERFQNSSVGYLRSIVPSWSALVKWMLLDSPPVSDPLWFLTALFKCYGVLWCYVRFFGKQQPNYQMLYLAGLLLYVLNMLLGVLSTAAGSTANLTLLRTTLLMGIPMFAMGLFLRQYWQSIWENFDLSAKKLWLLIALGILLSCIEQEAVSINDIHIGSVLIVLSAFLLMAHYPMPFRNPAGIALIRHFAGWSTGIYLVHNPVDYVLSGFFKQLPAAAMEAGQWVYPVCVALAAWFLAMGNSALFRWIKKTGEDEGQSRDCHYRQHL